MVNSWPVGLQVFPVVSCVQVCAWPTFNMKVCMFVISAMSIFLMISPQSNYLKNNELMEKVGLYVERPFPDREMLKY